MSSKRIATLAAYALAATCSISATSYGAGSWVNGQAATIVLGQGNFGAPSATVSQSVTSHVGGVAVDPLTGKVFVSDSTSHRILRFSSANALVSGSNAEVVFGQQNFTAVSSNAGGSTSAKSFFVPEQIHIDSGGRMWVADRENHRVLRFDSASTKGTYADADAVLGQATMTASTANRGGQTASNSLNKPIGVWHDGLALWVSDSGNNRVLAYGNPTIKPNGGTADIVLGQQLMTTNGTGTTLSQMDSPSGLVVTDFGVMYLTDSDNHRVLRFNTVDTKGSGSSADGKLGVAGFPTSPLTMNRPTGVAADTAGRVYVADTNNSRVLVYNDAVNRLNSAPADNVLGQPDLVTALNANVTGYGPKALFSPTGLYFDAAANALWVGEYNDMRAVRFSPFNALLDIDLSGNPTKFDALTDGLLIVRYLFGLSNEPLTAGAIGATANRTDPAQIKSYLDSIRPALDVDYDGKQDALTDGILITRYMMGLRNAALVNSSVALGAQRNTAAAIQAYIQSLMQ